MMVGFAFALPTLHVDSRFRGNDGTGARLGQNGVFALCVRNSLESLFDKEGLREFGGQGVEKAPCPTMARFDIMRMLECEKV
jgi:hypothetical protein